MLADRVGSDHPEVCLDPGLKKCGLCQRNSLLLFKATLHGQNDQQRI